MSQTTLGKRTFRGAQSGRSFGGRKAGRVLGGRSFSMVADSLVYTPKEYERLRLPASREKWLFVEQQIVSKAIEKNILEILEGTFVPDPLFSVMTVPEYLVDMDNTKVPPEPKKDHNGRTILILDNEGNPVQSGTLKIQSNLTDFTVDGRDCTKHIANMNCVKRT